MFNVKNMTKEFEFEGSPKINKITSCEIPNSCFKIPTYLEIDNTQSNNLTNDNFDINKNDFTSALKIMCSASDQ